MNILIKLMSIVSLVIAPYIAVTGGSEGSMNSSCCKDKAAMECQMGNRDQMGMGCEMDAEGNCIIDSTTCAAWMAEGKLDSSACVKMEDGKCHVKTEACISAAGSSCSKASNGCSKECMETCKAKGIDCSSAACPEKKSSCCKK